ncbi:MAG: Zn-dependent alcohol dehydrogenase [Proteobacteria bacterium]|nr:Zn-dependent alcohol dehydrogenase [Pseudomonadota bacterium]
MRAAILEAVGSPLVVRDDVELAAPTHGQVRVRVSHCGLCHSDLSVADGAFPAPTPIVLGHEAAGVVDEVGAGVSGLAPGDTVVLTACPPCGQCPWCARGQTTLCREAVGIMTNTLPDGTTGLSRAGQTVYRGLNLAAFSEAVVAPAAAAVKVPSDVPLDVACVIGCAVQTGVGAVFNTAAVEPGATVLVLGLGGIGLSTVQGARIAGASRILVSDPVPERRDRAKSLGATDCLDPNADDVVAAVLDATGVGVDYAFETAGRAALVEVGLAAARKGGTIVCVGAPPIDEAITIAPAAAFAVSEKKLLGCLLGSVHSARDIPRLVDLWRAGRLDLEALVTQQRPLDEINEAMDDLRASRGVRTVLSL